ncbi:Tn3 family transposase [Francisella philomiragia]|uniref:Tn3 family transposase n=1 Tax=Francisella philomiragia TaxID=28110 RepID=UPI0035148E2E
MANRFAKAVSFAPNQEINQIEQENQEKAAICKIIIQNSIILWNYIELTKLLMNEPNAKKMQQIIEDIKESSILTWKHVNMLGIYDFSRLNNISNDENISVQEILEYEAA